MLGCEKLKRLTVLADLGQNGQNFFNERTSVWGNVVRNHSNQVHGVNVLLEEGRECRLGCFVLCIFIRVCKFGQVPEELFALRKAVGGGGKVCLERHDVENVTGSQRNGKYYLLVINYNTIFVNFTTFDNFTNTFSYYLLNKNCFYNCYVKIYIIIYIVHKIVFLLLFSSNKIYKKCNFKTIQTFQKCYVF